MYDGVASSFLKSGIIKFWDFDNRIPEKLYQFCNVQELDRVYRSY